MHPGQNFRHLHSLQKEVHILILDRRNLLMFLGIVKGSDQQNRTKLTYNKIRHKPLLHFFFQFCKWGFPSFHGFRKRRLRLSLRWVLSCIVSCCIVFRFCCPVWLNKWKDRCQELQITMQSDNGDWMRRIIMPTIILI
jgi:hypothetical protein